MAEQPAFSAIAQGGPNRHEVLNNLVKRVDKKSVSILEVGSFEGQSALVWGKAIASYCEEGGTLLCIDPWSPDYLNSLVQFGAEYEEMQRVLADGTVYSNFCHNINLIDPKVQVFHMVGTLKDNCYKIASDQFDIVYLDGDHRMQGVSNDIALARGLVVPGGILCGDDQEKQYEDLSAVEQEEARSYADTHDYILGYHPGVTVAVSEAFGRVWNINGVWAVRKTLKEEWVPLE